MKTTNKQRKLAVSEAKEGFIDLEGIVRLKIVQVKVPNGGMVKRASAKLHPDMRLAINTHKIRSLNSLKRERKYIK